MNTLPCCLTGDPSEPCHALHSTLDVTQPGQVGGGLHHEDHCDHEQEPGGGAHPRELGPGEQRAQGVASEDTPSVQQGGHTAQAASLLSRNCLRNIDTEEGIHYVVTDMASPT